MGKNYERRDSKKNSEKSRMKKNRSVFLIVEEQKKRSEKIKKERADKEARLVSEL